jgi:hypothetical protein
VAHPYHDSLLNEDDDHFEEFEDSDVEDDETTPKPSPTYSICTVHRASIFDCNCVPTSPAHQRPLFVLPEEDEDGEDGEDVVNGDLAEQADFSHRDPRLFEFEEMCLEQDGMSSSASQDSMSETRKVC